MSSTYIPYVAFARDGYTNISLEEDIDKMPENCYQVTSSSGLMSAADTFSEVRTTIAKSVISPPVFKMALITLNGAHSCRETTISAIRNMLLAFQYRNSSLFHTPIVFVEYRKEAGYFLDKERVELIKWFGDTFFHEFSPKFGMRVCEDRVVLSYKYNTNTYMRDLWNISLFLYIFRKKEIMKNLLAKFNDRNTTSLDRLYDHLSGEFLKNLSWGDAANSPLALSLFCYDMLMIEQAPFISQSDYFENGPVNAACNFTNPNAIISYIRDVFFDTEGIKSVNWDKYMLNFVSAKFTNGFKAIYQMIWDGRNLKRKCQELTKKLKEADSDGEEE